MASSKLHNCGFAVVVLSLLGTYPVLGSFIPGKDLDSEWSHQIDLEKEHGVKFRWRNSPAPHPLNSSDDEGSRWLTMEVFARTKGYVGVGFSSHGGMAGGDIAIGWVDSKGKPHLKDFYAVANEQPILDESQDYRLISANENEHGTTIRFRRRWDTCDDNDMAIVDDTMRLIWAYSPFDPVLGEDGSTVKSMQWHGTKSRGAQSVYIVDDPLATNFPDENDPQVKFWDFSMDDNVVDAEHTTYFCKILKLPKNLVDKKHHMIGYKPILTPETKDKVHHIVFMECYVPPEHGGTESVFDKHLNNSGGRCYTPNMPPEWAKHCVTFLFVWLAGSEGRSWIRLDWAQTCKC